MDTAIVSALIGAAASLAVCLISNMQQQRKMDKEQDERMEKLRSDITQQINDVKVSVRVLETHQVDLTREVREHNGFAHRMPVVESEIENIKAELRRANA